MKLTIGLLFAVVLVAMSITIEANPSSGPLTSITTGAKVLTKEDGESPALEVCGECIQEVKGTIDQCKDTNDVLDCAKEVLGATSKCLECIGGIIDLVQGGDTDNTQTMITGTRILKDPRILENTLGIRDCLKCMADMRQAYKQCKKDRKDFDAIWECAKEIIEATDSYKECYDGAKKLIEAAKSFFEDWFDEEDK